MEQEGQINCVSCGCTLVGPSGQGVRLWGHSHNMPVKHYKHLEADPDNFKPRCQNWMGKKGCHEKLDEPDFEAISQFNDLPDIMEYRLQHSVSAYNQFVTGLRNISFMDYDYEDNN